MKISKILHSSKETEKFAAEMGARLKGGECIELISDLGGGKTTFTSGLVAGSGSGDIVSSPTFTINKQYQSEQFRFYHFDFYRLNEPGLVAEELHEAILDTNSVVIVEWAESVAHVLPSDRIKIIISKLPQEPDHREFDIFIPDTYGYILGDQK